MNWKLVMDTFTEPYHIHWLHKDSIAPYYLFDRWINDTYGPHPRFIGTKKSVVDEFEKQNEDDWKLLPHGTIQYLLVPNAVLVHQVDHVELWRSFRSPSTVRWPSRASLRHARRSPTRRGVLREEPRRSPRCDQRGGLPVAGASTAKPGLRQ
jgi:hypothetical protein